MTEQIQDFGEVRKKKRRLKAVSKMMERIGKPRPHAGKKKKSIKGRPSEKKKKKGRVQKKIEGTRERGAKPGRNRTGVMQKSNLLSKSRSRQKEGVESS